MVSPKIILNEDYVDLRKRPESCMSSRKSTTGTYTTVPQREFVAIRTTDLKSEAIQYEKELINSGLKKLVTSYNATANVQQQKQLSFNKKHFRTREKSLCDPRFRRFVVPDENKQLKSQSVVSVTTKKPEQSSTSTPVFKSKRPSSVDIESTNERLEPLWNKGTMTKNGTTEGRIVKPNKNLQSLLRDGNGDKMAYNSPLHRDYLAKQQSPDLRLCEKYSVLNMPWKRTWTIPLFKPKSSMANNSKAYDSLDRQTYFYDDGTDTDSSYIEDKTTQFCGVAFNSELMPLLFLGGSLCGMLLVSLLIWFIYDINFFHIFFKPRDTSDGWIRTNVKYVGGGVIYIVTTFFRTLGRVLAIPSQDVYQTRRWPNLPYNNLEV